jgi:regulator of sirC expression with transglutaminase-like and TPR domain
LSVQRKLDEGQTELESSLKSNSQEVALAHRYLAGIFLERREYDRAADQLEIYLKLVPKAADFDLLKRKAHELREKKSNNE